MTSIADIRAALALLAETLDAYEAAPESIQPAPPPSNPFRDIARRRRRNTGALLGPAPVPDTPGRKVGTAVYARVWGITPDSARYYLGLGLIPGATQKGARWQIPVNQPPPIRR